MTREKAKNVRVGLRMNAIAALKEMVATDPDSTDKEVASIAIMLYYKAWKERRNAKKQTA